MDSSWGIVIVLFVMWCIVTDIIYLLIRLTKLYTIIKNNMSDFSKLDILYDEKQIEELTVSKITFWNNSYVTINKTDLIENTPFAIEVMEGEFIDLLFLDQGNRANQVSANIVDKHKIEITFDYLDHKEGAILQVLHTGDENAIVTSKKIKGGKIVASGVKERFSMVGGVSALLFLISLIIIMLMSYEVFPEFMYEKTEVNTIKSIYSIPIKVIGFCSLIITSILGLLDELEINFTPLNCVQKKRKKKIVTNDDRKPVNK